MGQAAPKALIQHINDSIEKDGNDGKPSSIIEFHDQPIDQVISALEELKKSGMQAFACGKIKVVIS